MMFVDWRGHHHAGRLIARRANSLAGPISVRPARSCATKSGRRDWRLAAVAATGGARPYARLAIIILCVTITQTHVAGACLGECCAWTRPPTTTTATTATTINQIWPRAPGQASGQTRLAACNEPTTDWRAGSTRESKTTREIGSPRLPTTCSADWMRPTCVSLCNRNNINKLQREDPPKTTGQTSAPHPRGPATSSTIDAGGCRSRRPARASRGRPFRAS